MTTDLLTHEGDGLARCWWAGDPGERDARMVAYHDTEWGVPISGDVELFERLSLEGFQAGLSWSTILNKRDGFRHAFAGFEPAAVAAFDDGDRARLLADAGIVRNRAKVDATIGNAAALLAVVAEHGSFAVYLGNVLGRDPGVPRVLPPGTTFAQLTPTTPESDALSKDLKRRGFRFVGSTIVYAFMESVGIVDDHLPGCWRYRGG
ncbi:MAG: DNA-3-methyladenine glycosylase I [Chloroflexi bacterium]|jgi:DNA-3-methyladenine glycosylase I|nr:DNA-3-methyladenine glycosylase I [Chloroflexota bacterium]